MSVRIITDSTCDLPSETITYYGIGVVPLYINVGNQGYLDGIEITRTEFYKQLPDFPEHPTTAVPSPDSFRMMYESFARDGATEILSIHISISLSAVVDVARMAAQEFKSIPVTVFDSRQLSLGMGFLVEKAARLAQDGHSVDEIIPALNEQIQRTHVFAALDTLEFLKRSGRMNAIMAGLGSFLQLKPILTMYDGKPGAERVRTRQRAMDRLIEMLEAVVPFERLAIVHSEALDSVAELRQKAASWLRDHQVVVANLTPVIGAHIGPGVVGFAVVGAHAGDE
jgi:DegV family protein with EDD domain